MTDRLESDPSELPTVVEAERLRSLRKLRVVPTPTEDRFGVITRMARVSLEVPMAAISLVDIERQWCREFSVDHELGFTVPREQSLCRATIERAYSESDDFALIYQDLGNSEFAALPSVTVEGGVRFYAGFPLFGSGGHPIGTFCIYDTNPRRLNHRERATFDELAAWAQREIQNIDDLQALESAQALLRANSDGLLNPQVLLDAVHDSQGRIVDFRYRSVNKAACSRPRKIGPACPLCPLRGNRGTSCPKGLFVLQRSDSRGPPIRHRGHPGRHRSAQSDVDRCH